MDSQTFVIGDHPYYPTHVSVPNYVPNAAPLVILLGSFAAIIGIVVYSALLLATAYNPVLRPVDQAILGWFVLCTLGFAHPVKWRSG